MTPPESCRDALSGTKCRLGQMGCRYVQISGNSAENIANSIAAERKQCVDLPVLGQGQYDLMIIGENPSVEDDRRDILFQDAPSELLLEYLKKAGHDLSRVYMTKIVKCYPAKKSRKPAGSEISTCRDAYLRKEIEAIQPKVIMLIGSVALKAFNLTGFGSLNTIHGRVFEAKFPGWEGSPVFKVIPTVNPATFFYRPNNLLKARLGYDYVIAKSLIDGTELEPYFKPEYTLIDSIEKLKWLEEQVAAAPMFGFDTELAALNYRKVPLLSIQISWDWDKVAVIPVNQNDPNASKDQEFHILPAFGALHHEELKATLKRLFETEKPKAAHQYKYDYNVLRWFYGIKIGGFKLDTLLQKHLMIEERPSDLAYCCDLEFAWGDYECERRKITGSGKDLLNTFDKVPNDILWLYGATDALGTYRLACVYSERLQSKHPNLWKFYCEESEPLIECLASAEFKGSLINPKVLDDLETEWSAELDALLINLRATTNPDFNPMSTDQLIKAFNNLGVVVELKDDAAVKGYSSDKKKLHELQESGKPAVVKFAGEILEFRNRRKMLSTYINNARADLDSDGRLRYGWIQAGPVTGRLACTFFHQIPKIDKARVDAKQPIMRDAFIAPPGFKYVYGDFKQVELFILAIIADDREMIDVLLSGKDLHAITTYEFLKDVYAGYTELMAMADKFNRTEVGKRVNFGLAYGSEGHALVKTGKWKDATGQERQFTWGMLNAGMAKWKARFTGVGAFIDSVPDMVRFMNNIATNVFGRERHFGTQLTHENDYERGKAEREAINFYIQSVAASLTNRTIIEVNRMLKSFGITEDEICLINTVHDSVAYEVADHLVEWFTEALNIISSRAIIELKNHSFKIDIGVGQCWTEAELGEAA